jgi:hypothetical protein
VFNCTVDQPTGIFYTTTTNGNLTLNLVDNLVIGQSIWLQGNNTESMIVTATGATGDGDITITSTAGDPAALWIRATNGDAGAILNDPDIGDAAMSINGDRGVLLQAFTSGDAGFFSSNGTVVGTVAEGVRTEADSGTSGGFMGATTITGATDGVSRLLDRGRRVDHQHGCDHRDDRLRRLRRCDFGRGCRDARRHHCRRSGGCLCRLLRRQRRCDHRRC